MAVTDAAIAAIRAMITSGELKPGDRLPPEFELGKRLGLSRNSLREAVKALALIRILDVRQGDGTYVTNLEADTLVETLSFVIDLHHDASVVQLLEVRRLLEPRAVEMATHRLNSENLAELRVILDRIGNDSTVEELVEADLVFHRRINAACGNSYLAATIEGISGATARARLWRGFTETGAVQRTLAEHEAIYAAMAAGQADLAAAWATVHVGGVENWVRQHAETNGEDFEGLPEGQTS